MEHKLFWQMLEVKLRAAAIKLYHLFGPFIIFRHRDHIIKGSCTNFLKKLIWTQKLSNVTKYWTETQTFKYSFILVSCNIKPSIHTVNESQIWRYFMRSKV